MNDLSGIPDNILSGLSSIGYSGCISKIYDFSDGRFRMISRATVSPPTPESNTPMGASLSGFINISLRFCTGRTAELFRSLWFYIISPFQHFRKPEGNLSGAVSASLRKAKFRIHGSPPCRCSRILWQPESSCHQNRSSHCSKY